MGKLKRAKLFLRSRFFKYIIVPIASLHLLTQANSCRNDIIQSNYPTDLRKEFKEEYGFELRGWKNDIELNGLELELTTLAEVVDGEKRIRDFKPSCIRIEPDNYLKKTLFEQGVFIGGTYCSGRCFGNIIRYRSENNKETLHHEIKHKMTSEIVIDNPKFWEEWEEIAKEGKNPPYRNLGVQACKQLRILNLFVNDSLPQEKCEEYGFITDYSRTNPEEDVAEITENSLNPSSYLKYLYPKFGERNEIIYKKLLLAQKYSLIPQEFFDTVKLKAIETDFSNSKDNKEKDRLSTQFLEESNEFFNYYPNSVYSCSLRSERGLILQSRIRLPFDINEIKRELTQSEHALYKNQIEPVIEEHKLALASEYKNYPSYYYSLKFLEIYYTRLNEKDLQDIYHNAIIEYDKRRNSGNVRLSKIGVNDYLIEKGIDFNK